MQSIVSERSLLIISFVTDQKKSQSMWNLRRCAQAPSDRIHTIMEVPFRDPSPVSGMPSEPPLPPLVKQKERLELPMQETMEEKERRPKFGSKEWMDEFEELKRFNGYIH